LQAPSRPLYKGGSFISSWLRSGNNNNASNANFLTASGNNNNTTVSSVAAVRPALHSLAYKRQGKFSGIQKVQGPLNRKDLRMKGASVLPALIKQWRNLSNLVPTASAETFRRIWFISLHASGWAFFLPFFIRTPPTQIPRRGTTNPPTKIPRSGGGTKGGGLKINTATQKAVG
jgi:hypothetical protein